MLEYFQGVEKGVKYTKNLEIKLNPDLPCESDNTFTLDKSVFDFLSSYFEDTLNKEDVILSKTDLSESEHKEEFSLLSYLIWKYIQRYQELYSSLPDLSVVNELYFISDPRILNEKLREFKYSVLLNIDASPVCSEFKNEVLDPGNGVLLSCDYKNRFKEDEPCGVVLFNLF